MPMMVNIARTIRATTMTEPSSDLIKAAEFRMRILSFSDRLRQKHLGWPTIDRRGDNSPAIWSLNR
jgi:hypothetical protein